MNLAQAEHATLMDQVTELEDKLATFEKWEAEKQLYQLQEVIPGLFAYGYREGINGADPFHYICEHCYNDRKKSILQEQPDHRWRQNNNKRRPFRRTVALGIDPKRL
jgi:hypothetical protein